MRNWIVNILIVLALAWFVSDAIWKAQFSDDDIRMDQMKWMERN
jgi:hypothetical protein